LLELFPWGDWLSSRQDFSLDDVSAFLSINPVMMMCTKIPYKSGKSYLQSSYHGVANVTGFSFSSTDVSSKRAHKNEGHKLQTNSEKLLTRTILFSR
jgi:hypothetical protein